MTGSGPRPAAPAPLKIILRGADAPQKDSRKRLASAPSSALRARGGPAETPPPEVAFGHGRLFLPSGQALRAGPPQAPFGRGPALRGQGAASGGARPRSAGTPTAWSGSL